MNAERSAFRQPQESGQTFVIRKCRWTWAKKLVNIVVFLAKVEQCGLWPLQAHTLFLLFIPKTVTSEMTIVLLPTMIRWWEWLRAPTVQGRKKRSREKRDATEGYNGGAAGQVWEALLEMDKKICNVEEDEGGVTSVVDLAEARETVQLKGLDDVLWLPTLNSSGALRVL